MSIKEDLSNTLFTTAVLAKPTAAKLHQPRSLAVTPKMLTPVPTMMAMSRTDRSTFAGDQLRSPSSQSFSFKTQAPSRAASNNMTMIASNMPSSSGKVVRSQIPYGSAGHSKIAGMNGIQKRTTAIYAQAQDQEIDISKDTQKVDDFQPEKIINKYVEKVVVEKNPLYNAFTIGIDALNDRKLPNQDQIKELVDNTRDFVKERQDKVKENPRLWAYNTARTGFFIGTGLVSARQNELDLFGSTPTEEKEDNRSKAEKQKETLMGYTNLLMNYERLYDLDAEHIAAGYYREPYDSKKGHRQLNPAYASYKAREFFAEAKENIARRRREGREELPFVSGMYPDYYMNNFHFQSDGWLSSRSAAAYEFSTETLFSGSQDAMQRQILVPIHFWMKNQTKKEEDMKVLEVAGGTGRLMTFFRDNYPKMDATFLELSPYYLEAAAKNDRYYRKWFGKYDKRSKDIGELKPLNLVQSKAEDMKEFEAESFDILNCVYLFHEIPEDVRRQCAVEFFRVLKPGGIITFNDSIQKGDRDDRTNLGIFADRYNEPYYNSFIEEDLNAIFFEAGFKPGPTTPIVACSSKAMSWVKPTEDESMETVKALQEKYLEMISVPKAHDGEFEETAVEAPTTTMEAEEVKNEDGTTIVTTDGEVEVTNEGEEVVENQAEGVVEPEVVAAKLDDSDNLAPSDIDESGGP